MSDRRFECLKTSSNNHIGDKKKNTGRNETQMNSSVPTPHSAKRERERENKLIELSSQPSYAEEH